MNCNKGYKILIVDDEIEYQRVFSYILSSNGYSVKTSSSGAEALEVLKENEIDLVITDLKMPGIDGIELIKNIHEKYSDMDIMVMTAFGTIESAVKSMKYGANGYFIKGSEPESFIVEIDKLSKIKELQSSNAILKESNGNGKFFLETKSHEFAKMLEVCKKAAKTDINVHLSGESGVGKEVIANYIHQMSNRKDNHFIAVNCQVFPEGMVESELFGHEKGAFTGATEKRIGRFENANFGTLFLDEIGDLPIATQGKLLRVLETRTIERVGSSKNIELDIRLISATNKKLSDLISRGEFREDLMYRINTIDITIPPLRDRREDIPSLIEFFIMKIQTDQKKKIVEIEENTLKGLLEYNYPGNIRELRNILERLVALSDNGVIKGNGIKCDFERSNIDEVVADFKKTPLRKARGIFEKKYIERVLSETKGDVTAAAEILEISKRQMWNKISEYEIKK